MDTLTLPPNDGEKKAINPQLLCQSCEAAEANTFRFGKKLCQDCYKALESRNAIPGVAAVEAARKDDDKVIKSIKIDSSISVKTDIFNAETIAIMELKKAVFEDTTIEAKDKLFTFAKLLQDRQNNFKSVIFDLGEQLTGANNQLRATQTQLNELANKLRAEEREKLRLLDVNYKPSEVKSPKVAKPRKTSTKLDKVLLRNTAASLTQELGKPIPEFLLQQVVVMKGCSIEEAANHLRKSLKEGLSESSTNTTDTTDKAE